jgi:hypothetical protein
MVELSLSSKSIVAEQVLEVRCRTAGSRPPPSITWWKGSKQILHRDSVVVTTLLSFWWIFFGGCTGGSNRVNVITGSFQLWVYIVDEIPLFSPTLYQVDPAVYRPSILLKQLSIGWAQSFVKTSNSLWPSNT